MRYPSYGYIQVPFKLDSPDLRIELTYATRKMLGHLRRKLPRPGEHMDKDLKQGVLTLLSSDGKDTLATIRLHNLGLLRLSELRDQSEGRGLAVLRVHGVRRPEGGQLALPCPSSLGLPGRWRLPMHLE
jgi:hypothetical protein